MSRLYIFFIAIPPLGQKNALLPPQPKKGAKGDKF